jgi:hypothetical protein
VTPQGTRRFADLDALTREVLGESVPLEAWFDWLHGRPWPGAASTPEPGGAGFGQLGWAVDLSRFAPARSPRAGREPLPAVVGAHPARRVVSGPPMSLAALLDVPAPAKLNLFLHVSGRRDDGYHLIDSLMLPIDWCDTLHFERRGDGGIARHDLGPPLPADDLTLRAARALQAASATTLGADISVDKRVPWGAGLGGGSSDAATTLLALNRLWGLDWPLERLLPIGLALGADVPFFLAARRRGWAGIGEDDAAGRPGAGVVRRRQARGRAGDPAGVRPPARGRPRRGC